MLRLYDYRRSSAAYRVRIALALKGLEYQSLPIHLLKDGGEQHAPDYVRVNPQALVPALDADGELFTQSLAMIEYLDEEHPTPALLPGSAADRARVRAMALAVAADIHPIQNLRVLNYLRGPLRQPEDAVQAWARHWIETGLAALAALIARAPMQGRYCYGDGVTLADVVLAPQMVNARRFGCDLSRLHRLVEIDRALRDLPAFAATSPEVHPDDKT
ncbi:MAG: maleylacetoacetate isomerase [Rhodospirillaceae bacterium]|nr:maleylacetoacetate isomerase [Rhodospirillaceae bacterium]